MKKWALCILFCIGCNAHLSSKDTKTIVNVSSEVIKAATKLVARGLDSGDWERASIEASLALGPEIFKAAIENLTTQNIKSNSGELRIKTIKCNKDGTIEQKAACIKECFPDQTASPKPDNLEFCSKIAH